MPTIDCELRGFSGAYKKRVAVQANVPDLIRAAITVGDPTLVAGAVSQRPWLEMSWRIAMVLSNLSSTGPSWKRSMSYNRLDPSEKSAVSYFMGMVQARLTVESALRCSHLVHLDLLLKQGGRALGGKRPDFIAFRSSGNRSGYYAVGAVEAKGRTNGFDATVLAGAKCQARLIPSLPQHSMAKSPFAVASMAYFDDDTSAWKSVLEDPTSSGGEIDVSVEQCLVEYYRPVIGALRNNWVEEGDRFVARVDGVPYQVSVPRDLVEAFDLSQNETEYAEGAFVEALSVLDAAEPNSDFITVRETAAGHWVSEEERIRLLGGETDSGQNG